ncbi:MAG: hypothetical protein D6806_09770 [Deltaproteobacteria bacterium]|nr:MAG: hypothetical protein D6806_09770 [Deltaproteobacteria bacterium]
MKHNLLLVPLVTVLVAAGCGTYGTDDFTYQGYNLEEGNGGFAAGQPLPSFLEQEMVDNGIQEISFTQDDAEETEAEAQAPEGKKISIVRLLWGQFPFNRRIDQWTEWSGIVYARGAKVFIQRIIYYERHDFVRPCADRSCVLIDSRTLPHHDGLVLKVVPLPDANEPVRLFIGFAGLYGRILNADQMTSGFSEVATVDELGNKVVLNSLPRPACPAGMIAGLWKRLAPRGGVFAGRWLNTEGVQTGRLAGIWGRRRNGQRVFFGIYADNEGNFRGLLKGVYQPFQRPSGIDVAAGRFAGHWVNADGSLGGVLGGLYRERPALGAESGGFHGRFHAACEAEPLDPGELDPGCLQSGAEVCEPSGSPQDCECSSAAESGESTCSCHDGDGSEGAQQPDQADCNCDESDPASPTCDCSF